MKTLRTLTLAALAAGLAPVAVQAETITVTAAVMDTVRDAIQAAGCIVADETAASAVETATGYDKPTLAVVVEELREKGEVVNYDDQGGIRLTSGGCAN